VTRQYNIEIGDFIDFSFLGTGIETNGASVRIFNFGEIQFVGGSADQVTILNFNEIAFHGSSTAGNSVIHTLPDAEVLFDGSATGGSAGIITDVGSLVDFSGSSGPVHDHRVSAGSIAGAGIYQLGGDELTVGSDGLSTTVSGPIADGGLNNGTGASLVKAGHGTLTLSHAGNTYSGGTTLEQGTLDLAAIRAAGTGAITFAGRARLKIEGTALSGHVFANPIDGFAKHDVLDLSGLHFHAGATATYHKGSHHLTVHSGHLTDTLTLNSPHGMHFDAVNDGHGGTAVFLIFA
jgi:autotransporter-associated beta strand protein